jgi:hypothetical protein
MKPRASNNLCEADTAYDDRRSEPRVAAAGEVRLSDPVSGAERLRGEILDLSWSGFRLAHRDAMLPRGEEFLFESLYGSGRARVVWNRVSQGAVESGFFVVERDLKR